MGKFLSEEQEKEMEAKSSAMDFLLDLIGGGEDGPIDFKLMKAHRDLSRAMHDLMLKEDFLKKDDEPKKAVLSILQQAIEVIKDTSNSLEAK